MNIKHWLIGSILLGLSAISFADHRHAASVQAVIHYNSDHDHRSYHREQAYWRGYRQGYREARRSQLHRHRNTYPRWQHQSHYQRHIHSRRCGHHPAAFNSRVRVNLTL